MHLQQLGMGIRFLRQVDTAGLLREFGYNDSIGVLLDPTGWMRIRDNASKNERAVRALAHFMHEMEDIWPEIKQLDLPPSLRHLGVPEGSEVES